MESFSPPSAASSERGAGIATSLRAGLNAGLAAGSLLGCGDALVAGVRSHLVGALAWVGCVCAAIALYGLVFGALGVVLGLVGHPLLARRAMGERIARLTIAALGLGLFFELFWWSREHLLWGVPVTDPRRLAAAAAMLPLGWCGAWCAVRAAGRLPRALRWGLAALVPLCWLIGGSYWLWAQQQSSARGAPNARTRPRPNVLLVVVDALRQDVLGCYGNEHVATPVLDGLAARGFVFDNAWTAAPFTWSSFGSILTGKFPRRHGLVKMAANVSMSPNITLPWHFKGAPLLGEEGRLEPDDYASAAFLTGMMSQGSGLLRGFDAYFEAMEGHDLVDTYNPWSHFRSELVLSLLRTKLEGKLLQWSNEDPVVTQARRWFDANGRSRFVAMVHLYSTHTPYDPAPRFRGMYVDPDYDGPLQAFYSDARLAIEEGRYQLTAADRAQIANLYYAGVSQADAMIGELLDELRRQGVLDDTLVIVTSDHGEELGDHDLWEHNFMYETNLRVPWILALPGRVPVGRSQALVQLVDLVPTVCSLAALQPPYEPGQVDEAGRDRGALDGIDLLPLMRGERSAARPFSFAENGVYLAVRDERYKLVVPAESLERPDWDHAPQPGVDAAQLYDLAEDPTERTNRLADLRPQAERLLAILRAFSASMPIPRNEILQSHRDQEALIRRMEQLGYAGGVGQGTGSDGHRK